MRTGTKLSAHAAAALAAATKNQPVALAIALASRLRSKGDHERVMRNSPATIDLVCALALYLRANPLACDSLEGIGRWWLAAHAVSREELEHALAWMMEHGLVEEIAAADGRLRYRRCGADSLLQAAIEAHCRPGATRH